jgi:hypothetical protein
MMEDAELAALEAEIASPSRVGLVPPSPPATAEPVGPPWRGGGAAAKYAVADGGGGAKPRNRRTSAEAFKSATRKITTNRALASGLHASATDAEADAERRVVAMQNDRKFKQLSRLKRGQTQAAGQLEATGGAAAHVAEKAWSKLRISNRLASAVKSSAAEMQMLRGQMVQDYDAKWEVEKASRGRCWYAPEDAFKQAWDAGQALLLLYVAVLVPLRIAYDVLLTPGEPSWWLELAVDCLFVADVWFNFRTGYYEEGQAADNGGALVLDARAIRARYCRSWFAVDLLSILPAGYIVQIMEDGEGGEGEGGGGGQGGHNTVNTKAVRIARLARIAKMLRLAKVKRDL